MKSLKYFLPLTLLMFFHETVDSQNLNLQFQHLTNKDGLSENTVLDIAQDSTGFMWFATENGLTKFDGINFEVYRHDPFDTLSLASDEIQSLCVYNNELLIASVYPTVASAYSFETGKFRIISDYEKFSNDERSRIIRNNNYVLMFTHNNKYIYVDSLKKFTEYEELNTCITNIRVNNNLQLMYSTNTFESTPIIESYFLSENNQLFAYLSDLGIYSIDLTDFSSTCLINANELFNNYLIGYKDVPSSAYLFLDKGGRIWFNINNHALSIFNPETKEFNSKIPATHIKDVFETADRGIWFATASGLYFFDSHLNKSNSYTHISSDFQSLTNDYIASVFINNHDILWVGHDAGGVDFARYFNIKKFRHFLKDETANNFLSKNITGVHEGQSNEVWISTDKGVNMLNMKTMTINSYLKGEFIRNVFCDSRGNVWCFNQENKIFIKEKYQKDFRKNQYLIKNNIEEDLNEIPLLFEDSRNRLWLINNGLYQYNYTQEKFLKNSNITEVKYASSIKEDKNGYFWISGTNDKLLAIHPDKLISLYFQADMKNPYSLSSNILWDVHIDRYDNLWVATNKGVNKANIRNYNNGDLLFESISIKDGLANEIVFRILEDSIGNMWFATNNGLSKLIRESDVDYSEIGVAQNVINYFKLDGIASNKIGCISDNLNTYLCGSKLSNGDIILGSDNGLTHFNPSQIEGNKHLPKVVITDLKIFNKSVPIGKGDAKRIILSKSISMTNEINLNYHDRVFSFDFVAMDYSDPKQNQYAYKLEGFNEEWIYLNNSRSVTFTNLKGNEYILRVIASNNEGLWNPSETSIIINITPPLWDTWWFKLTGVLLVLISFYAYFKYRTYAIKARNLELETLVNNRTSELKEANQILEEKSDKLEHQSEELTEINFSLTRQKSELEELNKEVKLANQARLQFFTNVSHELRTPLTLIIGPIECILSKEVLKETVKKQIEIMYRNASRLLTLINQLLDLRKLEVGHLKLAVSEGDIVHFLNEKFSNFTALAEQKNIDFKFNSALDKFNLWFDNDKIEKIFSNLLSNAFKYTPDGGKIIVFIQLVEKTAAASSKDNPTSFLEFSVADNGIGIHPDKINHIFERFYSSEESNDKNISGAGIGLELTKKLVEIHKARISVESTIAQKNNPASGTTFTILLPIGKESFKDEEIFDSSRDKYSDGIELPQNQIYQEIANHILPETASEESEKINGPKILVVDDNPDLRDYLSSILVNDYRVFFAENGEAGLQIVQEHDFDLIISDIMMPFMDGVEFCRNLKTNVKSSHIPVILLTAKTAIDSQIKGLETGADDYITKPFNHQILITKIRNIIESRRKLRLQFDKQLIFKPEELATNSVDLKLLKRANEIVEAQLSNPDFDITMFSQEMCMSKSTLYEKLKGLTGQTINDFISAIRLKNAAQLIVKGELNISEVSLKVGYLDSNYFSKLFKKHFGVVPSKFVDKH